MRNAMVSISADREREATPETFATPRTPIVLLIEDDTEMRRLVAEKLREGGFRVVDYSSGARIVNDIDAAFFFDCVSWVPDLIVSDVRLPGHSGLEILRRIRQADLDVPVIIMTAFATPTLREQAASLGAARVLNKPFDLDQLVRMATEIAFAKH